MEAIIELKNLTHVYSPNTPFQQTALDHIDLSIYQGECLGIIGRTGSGKSTLIQHLNGLLKPTGGRILLGDRDIWAEPKKIRDVRFRVGLVFQYPEYQLFEETAYKDIAFGPKNMGLDEAEVDRMMENTDPEYVSLLFDTGHFAYCGVDPLKMVKKYADRIKHVHLKDIRREMVEKVKAENLSFLDGVRMGTFTVPGDGCIDFDPIFKVLEETGYEGYMLVEAEQDPAKANPLEYAMKARKFIAEKTGL